MTVRITANNVCMVQVKWSFMKNILCNLIIRVMLFCIAGLAYASDIQVVNNLGDLENIINTTWNSNSVNKIMPPGDAEYKNSFGAISYATGFDTNFLDSLIAVTNNSGTNSFILYPLEVSETTNASNGRVRNYYSAISTNPAVLHSETVNMTNNYPFSWVENVFGEPPQWLSGFDLQKWYDDRDPWRQHVFCDLIATSSVPDYMAMLTNIVYTYSGTNTNSVLSIYSNNIVFFETGTNSGEASIYLHAPTNVASLDIFSITNLLDVSTNGAGWNLTATMEHNIDPLLLVDGIIDPLKFICAGNAVVDSDGDGLSDVRELKMFGTDMNLADTDGDGIDDGDELLRYGLDALNDDTDGDGLLDGDEYFSKILAWGDNYYGQCDIPLGLSDVIAIDTMWGHNLALHSDGSITAWGDNSEGQCSIPAGLTNVVAISAGVHHSMVLNANGTVVAWGGNSYSQCDVPAGLSNVVAIVAGNRHSLSLTSDGLVTAWGANYYNQCDVPAGLSNVIAIAVGYYHNVALRSNGMLTAWGRNNHGQCDIPSGLTNVTAIAAGASYTLALRSDKTVTAWGVNDYGQCNVPSGLNNVIAIDAGYYHGLAIKSDKTVTTWGDNSYNQRDAPTGLSDVTAIAGGSIHSIALIQKWVNPHLTDTDGDNLSDGDEVNVYGTDPSDTDTDDDNLFDGWEVLYSFNPLDPTGENGADGDPENDKLRNIEEQQAGTHPRKWDTDGDILPDGWEVQYGLNPLVANNVLIEDIDNDGLSLFDEYRYVTNPNDADTDDDGIDDGDEVPQSPGSNPNEPDDVGNPTNCVTLMLTVGDPSGSHSERWRFDVFHEEDAVIHHVDDGFGTPGSKEYALVKGKEYRFKVNWVATDPGYSNYPTADYDWQALINNSSSTGLCYGLYNTGVFFVENPDNLLTSETSGNDDNLTIGKEGKIIIPRIDIDVDTDRDGVFDDEDDEAGEDEITLARGALVPPLQGAAGISNTTNINPAVLSTLIIRKTGVSLPDGYSLRIYSEIPYGKAQDLTLWSENGTKLFSGGEYYTITNDYTNNDVSFCVSTPWTRGMTHMGDGELSFELQLVDNQANVIDSDHVKMYTTPIIFAWNGQPVENIYGTSDFPDDENIDLAAKFKEYSALEVWVQDFMELGKCQYKESVAAEHILDLDHNGTGSYIKEMETDSSTAWQCSYWVGLMGNGGNIEVTPPYGGYPYGRVLLGTKHAVIVDDYIQAQGVQTNIIKLDTDWLLVGHVDEMISFINTNTVLVPDPWTAADLFHQSITNNGGTNTIWIGTGVSGANDYIRTIKDVAIATNTASGGYKITSLQVATDANITEVVTTNAIFAVNDYLRVDDEIMLVTGINGTTSTVVRAKAGRPAASHPAGSAIYAISERLELNLPTDEMNGKSPQEKMYAVKTNLTAQLGSYAVDFLPIPVLFEVGAIVNGEKEWLAETANMVNCLVDPDDGIYMSEPGSDIFRDYVTGVVPAAKFLNVWVNYHCKEGEVHCGSNTRRTLNVSTPWWDKINSLP